MFLFSIYKTTYFALMFKINYFFYIEYFKISKFLILISRQSVAL